MTAISLATFLGVSWLGFFWNFLGAVLVLICLLLTIVILIQDSKGAGLTSAFGAGPGGESLLGARMQKDVARWTIYLATAFSVIVIVMGLIGTYTYRYDTAATAGAKASAPKAAAPAVPGPAAGPESGAAAPAPAIPPAGPAAPESKTTSPTPAAPAAGASAMPATAPGTPAPAAGTPVPAPAGTASPPAAPVAPANPAPAGEAK